MFEGDLLAAFLQPIRQTGRSLRQPWRGKQGIPGIPTQSQSTQSKFRFFQNFDTIFSKMD
jgi:hypothetical protein